jgi:hypothetical protein
MDEAPYITHNLQNATSYESEGEFSWRIYPDEGVAPYALYVILGHLTRPAILHPEKSKGQRWVEGNPYFERGLANADYESEIAQFESWIQGVLE